MNPKTVNEYLEGSRSRTDALVRGEYLRKIEQKIRSLRYTPADLLDKNARITQNGTSDDADEINELINEYHQLADKVYLSLLLPVASPERAVVDDIECRKRENKHIFELLQRDPNMNENTTLRIDNFQQFENAVRDFVSGDAANAKEAFIIINGHGGRNGMEFYHDGIVAWDKVMECINSRAQQRSVQGIDVPTTIHVVNGACFAHESQKYLVKEVIKVTTFTTEENRTTISELSIDSVTGNINDIHHLALELYAKQQTHYMKRFFRNLWTRGVEFVAALAMLLKRLLRLFGIQITGSHQSPPLSSG